MIGEGIVLKYSLLFPSLLIAGDKSKKFNLCSFANSFKNRLRFISIISYAEFDETAL